MSQISKKEYKFIVDHLAELTPSADETPSRARSRITKLVHTVRELDGAEREAAEPGAWREDEEVETDDSSDNTESRDDDGIPIGLIGYVEGLDDYNSLLAKEIKRMEREEAKQTNEVAQIRQKAREEPIRLLDLQNRRYGSALSAKLSASSKMKEEMRKIADKLIKLEQHKLTEMEAEKWVREFRKQQEQKIEALRKQEQEAIDAQREIRQTINVLDGQKKDMRRREEGLRKAKKHLGNLREESQGLSNGLISDRGLREIERPGKLRKMENKDAIERAKEQDRIKKEEARDAMRYTKEQTHTGREERQAKNNAREDERNKWSNWDPEA